MPSKKLKSKKRQKKKKNKIINNKKQFLEYIQNNYNQNNDSNNNIKTIIKFSFHYTTGIFSNFLYHLNNHIFITTKQFYYSTRNMMFNIVFPIIWSINSIYKLSTLPFKIVFFFLNILIYL